MTPGQVRTIYIGPQRKGPMVEVDQVKAITARGLEGDRFCRMRLPGRIHREVTLIESEAILQLRQLGIDLPAHLTRRNLVTSGIDLNRLVGVTFRVGDVVVRGVELARPCAHLERMVGLKLLGPMHDLGGLCVAVLCDGTIEVGSPIVLPEEICAAVA